jgi:RNA polymerase II elongation factor ELL
MQPLYHYSWTDKLPLRTIVGHATPVRTPGHRRFPSTSFKVQHPMPGRVGSPLPDTPSSSMAKRPPTSQPAGTHDAILRALRVPILHLLAREPATDASLAATCRTSTAMVRDIMPKIAKRSAQDSDKWQLTDKSFREITPWSFPYSSDADREQAVESAIKAFDRLRLTKDDKLWQILLPREERGQGKCLSRSKVKALEAKPKASTPLQKVSDFTKKKAVAKKSDDKIGERKPRVTKDPEPKPNRSIKEKTVVRERPIPKDVKDQTPATAAAASPAVKPATLHSRTVSTNDASKIRPKKAPVPEANPAPRTKPKMPVSRELPQERTNRPVKPIYNTKPKNPSPLSASPPVNASDFADSHPVHKALAAAASPVKASYGNSDRNLKRKANDIDSDIHNHNVVPKKTQADRTAANRTPSNAIGKLNGSTPSSSASLKRKSDESSASNTPSTAPKARRVANINTGLASRYKQQDNSHLSPSDSSSTTSPTQSALSFRQTVELSQKFQRYYIKYEELYWRLTEATSPPTESQRKELLNMHKKLEEMKREIKAGARMQR